MEPKKPARRGRSAGNQQADQGAPGSSGQAMQSLPVFEPLHLSSHRQLVTEQGEIFRRFNENPDLAKLLFINPVMALREVGVTATPEIGTHILHTIQHQPRLRNRRLELETELKEALGQRPQPNNPEWVATLLFEELKVRPLSTRGHHPAYRQELSEQIVARLQKKLRPPPRKRPLTRPDSPGMAIRVRTPSPTVRRLDLDAPLPALKPADKAPKSVSLETLYFYKESHPLVRDLLELGMLERRSFPVHTGDSFRRIKSGEKPNAFHAWITAIRFPVEDGDEPDR